MKKAILLLVILIGYMAYAQQDDSTLRRLKKREYKTTINSLYCGYLVNISDSSLQVSNSFHPFRPGAERETYLYHQVDKVEILPAANPLKGALIGGLLGLAAGGAVGVSAFKHQYPNRRVIFYEIGQAIAGLEGAGIGALTGAISGALIGHIKHKIQVNRDREKFKDLYARVRG